MAWNQRTPGNGVFISRGDHTFTALVNDALNPTGPMTANSGRSRNMGRRVRPRESNELNPDLGESH